MFSSYLFTDDPWYDINVVKALLFYLVQNRQTKNKKQSSKNCEQEALSPIETVIQFIEYEENVMSTVKKMADKYKNSFHPFLIIGKVKGLPYKYYLSVFDIIYTFESFAASFDCLFKSFFVLNVGYPTTVRSFYTFVQQFIYNIYLPEDRSFPAVIDLIDTLDSGRLPSQQT